MIAKSKVKLIVIVGRAITIVREMEERNEEIIQNIKQGRLELMDYFKIGGTNNIFVDCTVCSKISVLEKYKKNISFVEFKNKII